MWPLFICVIFNSNRHRISFCAGCLFTKLFLTGTYWRPTTCLRLPAIKNAFTVMVSANLLAFRPNWLLCPQRRLHQVKWLVRWMINVSSSCIATKEMKVASHLKKCILVVPEQHDKSYIYMYVFFQFWDFSDYCTGYIYEHYTKNAERKCCLKKSHNTFYFTTMHSK